MCTLVYMNVSDFRKDLKECLDRAVKGETIRIERGGVGFELKATTMVVSSSDVPMTVGNPSQLKTIAIPPPVAKTVKVPASKAENGLCKVHGLPLTDYGRCLQKGCKYA